MHADPLNILRPTLYSRILFHCLLSLAGLDSTHARSIYKAYESCKGEKTNLSVGRRTEEVQLQPISNSILNSNTTGFDNDTKGKDNIGALVSGAIAAGIIFGLVVFMCFKIRKEYLLFRQRRGTQTDQTTTTTVPREHGEGKQSLKDRLSSISATLSQHGDAIRRAVSRNDDTSSTSSELSFGDLTTPATMLDETINTGSSMPPKAANAIGFRFSDASTQAPSIPLSPPMAATPPPPLCVHEPYWESGQKAAISQTSLPRPKSSSSSLSTLGRTLLQDTMHPPEPQKYATPPIPQRPLTPLPPPTPPPLPLVGNDDDIRRNQSRRYFVPAFGAEERLPSPTSLPKRMGAGSRDRDSSEASRYSMGDNVI